MKMLAICRINRLLQSPSVILSCSRSLKSKLPIESFTKKKIRNIQYEQKLKIPKAAEEAKKDLNQFTKITFFGIVIIAGFECYNILEIVGLDRVKNDNPMTEMEKERITRLFTEVIADMNVSRDASKIHYELIDQLSFYCKVIGCPDMNIPEGGASGIGIPYYIKYSDSNEVCLEDLKHRIFYKRHITKKVDKEKRNSPLLASYLTDINLVLDLGQLENCSNEDIQKLKETFVLSEKAKKFLLASGSVEHFNQFVGILQMLQKFLFLGFFVMSSSFAIEKTNLGRLPLPGRLGFYATCFSAAGLFTLLIGRMLKRELHITSDTIACRCGKEYAEGGIELYTKVIERIDLLRKMLPKCQYYFNEECDLQKEVVTFMPVLRVKERLELCQTALKKLDNNLPIEMNSMSRKIVEYTLDFKF